MTLGTLDFNLIHAVLGSLGFGLTLLFAGGARNILQGRTRAGHPARTSSPHPAAWRAARETSLARGDDVFRF